jgi:hypothetical protein
MEKQSIYYKGTEINKISLCDFDVIIKLEEKGFNVMDVMMLIADDNNNAYVSNGFIRGLMLDENEPNEWHHYFVKHEDGSFEAEKMYFDLEMFNIKK